MNPDKKLQRKLENMQQVAFFIFVPAVGIAIFSDNKIFSTIAFISAIIFATLMYVERWLR